MSAIVKEIIVNELLNLKREAELLPHFTNEMWQDVFEYLKDNNKPSKDKRMKRNVDTRVMQRSWGLSSGGGYTLDEYYIGIINDALDIMRGKYKDEEGVIGIVYHVCHIKDLLKYEPGMKSELVNDDGFIYFKVWLQEFSHLL